MLENTLYKLTVEKKLKIVFFGGSITDGTGSSDEEKYSYRARVTKWFRDTYPDAEIESINASIGGTGTGYGMFRIDKDVLRHKPDLVFVEFCGNDFGDTYDNVLPRAETIFRKIIKADPATDAIAVVSAYPDVADVLEAGLEYESRDATVTAAHRYSVPVIDAGMGLLFRVLREGGNHAKLIPDGLHPSDSGHSVMAEKITGVLTKLFEEAKKPAAITPHALPVPISPDIPEEAKMNLVRNIGSLKLNGFGFEKADDRLFEERIASSKAGDSFSFDFSGPALGFIWDGGCVNGDVKVSVDGGDPVNVRSWDHAVRSFHRMQAALFMKGLDPAVQHHAEVTVSNLYIQEGGAEGFVRILAVLTE